MPKISIEEKFWTDDRVGKLVRRCGEVLGYGYCLLAWKLAQHYWLPDKDLIPDKSWKVAGLPEDLFELGLAERREGGIYVSGTEKYHAWYFTNVEKYRKRQHSAGVASAKRPRDKKGRLLPSGNTQEARPTSSSQAQPSPAKSNSYSYSSSSSSSSTSEEKKRTTAPAKAKSERWTKESLTLAAHRALGCPESWAAEAVDKWVAHAEFTGKPPTRGWFANWARMRWERERPSPEQAEYDAIAHEIFSAKPPWERGGNSA